MTQDTSSKKSERAGGRAWIALGGTLAGAALFAFALIAPELRSDKTVPTDVIVPTPDESSLEPRVAEAVRAARDAVVADPSNLETWTRYAHTLDVHNVYPEAALAYQEALKLAPADPELNYMLSVMLWNVRGRAPEAEALLTRTAELQPKYPPPFARLGTWLAASGRYSEARVPFERALDIDPTFVFAHRELGAVLLALGLTDEALEHLETAQAAVPNDRLLQETLTQAYREQNREKDVALAQERVRRSDDIIQLADPVRDALQRFGVSGWHCYWRALGFIGEGKFEYADRELATVRQTLWSNPKVRLGLAHAYHRRDKKNAALREYRATLALVGDDPRAHLGVATLLNERQQHRAASEHWVVAVDAFPNDAKAHLGYADCLAATESPEDALAQYALAGRLGEPTAESLTNWGTALMRTGAADEAVEKYTGALQLDSSFADAHFNLGFAYEQLGRTQDAIAEYRLGAKTKPRHPAIQRLKDLEKESTP